MSATKHSAQVFLVVDSVQDYEESLTILGVYGSLAAAKRATPRLRATAPYFYLRDSRDTEIQHWAGDEHISTWTYHGNPDSSVYGTWTYEEHP